MDPKSIKQPFWSMSVEETLKVLETRTEGLSEEEAKKRTAIFGSNEIKDGKEFSGLKLFLNQFRSPLIFILLFAGVVTIFLKDWLDTGVILAAVLVNVFLGFYQEAKAENVLELLKSYVKTRTRIRRAGSENIIDASGLVPGDIIRITQGDKIPADGRIIFASNFEVDESVLTGESIPVEKKTEPVETSAGVSDRDSMVFGSTLAVSGFADVAVTSTGASTEFGKIAALLEKKDETKTPLQIAISRFSFWAGLILLIMTVTLFSFGVYLKYDPLQMFLIAVAVAVSAVPEGLPIALTVIMAVGVEQLARKKGIVRRLLAAETLGSTSLILTDKTGTLTEAKMELTAIIPYKPRPFSEERGKNSSSEDINNLLSEAMTTVDVVIENPNDESANWRMFGNIMEVALVVGAAKKGIFINQVLKENQIYDRLSFSSDRKFAASVHAHNSSRRMMLLGAPEIILRFTGLSEEEKTEVEKEINERAFSGERVLGVVSMEPAPDYEDLRKHDFKNLNFDGLITFRDPLRPGVFESMKRINEAGVKTIIVTGDHRGTAEAVARELGLVDGKGAVLTGDDLNHLSKEELYTRADKVTVYARVTPEQKVEIAKMYKEKGEIVAMTGDGVNDAPALDAANIGVALGSGTDVTKSAADLVILDNNYETIVTAIEQGRRIMDNIKKVIVYLLSNSLDELFLLGGAMLTGIGLPLTATQILFVNFFSDSFPAVAFAFEKEIDGLGHQPRKLAQNLFDKRVRFLILGIGLTTSALLFVVYFVLIRLGFVQELVKTFIFATFATYSLLVSFSLRSLDVSIFKYNPFSNKYLVGGVLFGILMTLSVVYLPFLQKIMGTVPLPLPWVVGVVFIGIFNILAVEFGKWVYKKLYADR
ncbi:MAG: cation-transporting P-type ATPase [Candidatus Taylorbacteria bacterium]|nr:cation-transporting P-type ATPase [Candidatus Taylorbacteria bacterium]